MFRETWRPETRSPNDWREQAACLQVGHVPFFPDRLEGHQVAAVIEPALSICRDCPVRAECLEFALTHDERYGIWGGTLPSQRRQMQKGKRP